LGGPFEKGMPAAEINHLCSGHVFSNSSHGGDATQVEWISQHWVAGQ
jgi:hypothetical protein